MNSLTSRFRPARLVGLGAALMALGLPVLSDAQRCPRGFISTRAAGGGGGRVAVRSLCKPSAMDAAGAAARASVPVPTVEGATGGLGRPTVQGTGFDLAPFGYEVGEYFLSGTARGYLSTRTPASNGRWSIAPDSEADYKTRIVVYRPIDPADFNGSVVVEWLNVSGGLDAAPDWISMHTELLREGYVWIGVSAQVVGIEGSSGGIAGLNLFLKGADPERYGSLVHPGDTYSFDMFSQVGQSLRAATEVDPLGGLQPDRIIAVGESQSAFRLTTYVNAFEPVHQMYDGYMIHSRGGGSSAISQGPQPSDPTPEVVRTRTDLEVPVLIFQTETDLFGLGYLPDRQPDTRFIRLWEVAGSAHADIYTLLAGGADRGDDPSVADIVVTAEPIPGIIECGSPINAGPQHWVLKAAMHALDQWVRTGVAPRRAPRLLITADQQGFALDEFGNVRGGIRSPYVDAPLATLSGLGQSGGNFCGIFGTTVLLDDATIDRLYPDHGTYVQAVEASLRRAEFLGYIRPIDADLIRRAAAASDVGR